MVEIKINDQSYSLPLIEGTEGEKAIDIADLRKLSGAITLDHGYVNTGACTSSITFLDGEQGILRYRGYPIEQLAGEVPFMNIAYLLRHGELPPQDRLQALRNSIAAYPRLPEPMTKIIAAFPKDAHPMAILSTVLASFGGIFPQYAESDPTEEQRDEMFARLLAEVKNTAAACYRHSIGESALESRFPDLDYVSDFYYLCFGKEPTKAERSALDTLLVLHADHEQNCSTSTVRLVGSSKVSLFSAVSAAVNALWGPLHGGANQAVIEMLEQIQDAGGDYKEFLQRAKSKDDPFKLMGFGHRVYKNFDPRANIIKKSCDEVLSQLGVKDPLLDIAKGLEDSALTDQYFVDRKLYPNVDFYSGIIYKALGIPTNMFTVLFALGRLPGWLAQWEEMRTDPQFRIGRPRQIYQGPNARNL